MVLPDRSAEHELPGRVPAIGEQHVCVDDAVCDTDGLDFDNIGERRLGLTAGLHTFGWRHGFSATSRRRK